MKTSYLIIGGFAVALIAVLVLGIVFASSGDMNGVLENLFANVVFVGAAMGAVIGSTLAVTRGNPVYAILSLLAVFVCMAILFFLLSADLLAVLQLTVYAGAVLMLFLFVIMLFNLGSTDPAAELGEHGGRETADQAERHGFGLTVNTPKMRGLVVAFLLAVLLIVPILKLEGEQWERFLPMSGEAIHTPDGFRCLAPLEAMPAWVAVPERFAGNLHFAADVKRLAWDGPMTKAQHDALLELAANKTNPTDAESQQIAQWQAAVNRLYDTARWAALEHQGMSAEELAEVNNTRIEALMVMGKNRVEAERADFETAGQSAPGFGSVPRVGQDLFIEYVVAFEFIAILILVGCVGTIVLAKKRPKDLEEEAALPPDVVEVTKDKGMALFSRKHFAAEHFVHPPPDESAPGTAADSQK